jgi:hypothetical protein
LADVPPGLIPCDEVLLCVQDEPCEECDPFFVERFGKMLTRGKYYRAKARQPEERGGGWWIPEIHADKVDDLERGVTWSCVIFCAPHFGHENREKNATEISDLIKRCTHIKETEDA